MRKANIVCAVASLATFVWVMTWPSGSTGKNVSLWANGFAFVLNLAIAIANAISRKGAA